ncbi:MAG: hypothetical protein WCG47_01180 [Dermatophilaceae bacterium]
MAHAWARATYLVSAEARDILRVIKILDEAISVGSRVNDLRDDAIEHLHDINHADKDNQYADRWLDDALTAERKADAIWSDDSHGPYRNLGGKPRPVDVGTAGDQTFAIRLLRSARTLTEQVAQMAPHPSLQDWASIHPTEAKEFTLCTHLPDNLLQGQPRRLT